MPGTIHLRARGRKFSRSDGMNKTEAAYSELLESKRLGGEIAGWWYEPVNLRIGVKCFYRPDFMVMQSDGAIEFHECKAAWGNKAGWQDDARVKVRAVAALFPMFKFIAAVRHRDRWEFEEF